MTKAKLYIWHENKVIAVFDETVHQRLEDQDLIIYSPDGAELKRYRKGEWTNGSRLEVQTLQPSSS